ncbi:hypothetical protein AVEN_66909-1 [Araneus ventricosus]|uniref:Uncharacterized protein n=1 Tax=Araneus ventricosus TaxID=182803 RepID=A0A4Y2SU07_ARAVE|nr:hypothetical protein AVEN_66909-1 [Araneus ventricosus]
MDDRPIDTRGRNVPPSMGRRRQQQWGNILLSGAGSKQGCATFSWRQSLRLPRGKDQKPLQSEKKLRKEMDTGVPRGQHDPSMEGVPWSSSLLFICFSLALLLPTTPNRQSKPAMNAHSLLRQEKDPTIVTDLLHQL